MNYPPVDLAYLRAISDCTGILQHGTHSVPNRHLGYTTDDNARALIIAVQHYEMTDERQDLDLAITYLSYLLHAQSPDRKFRNIMTFQRTFLDEEITEDCYGRTMWACGYTASSELPLNVKIVAKRLFDESIGIATTLISPRAVAYSILGICDYLRTDGHDQNLLSTLKTLADYLIQRLHYSASDDWYWYEQYLTYGNAILPLALLETARTTGSDQYMEAALRTARFLTEVLVQDGRLNIIGNRGWYTRGEERAVFDQQAIDAGYTVYLYTKAYDILRDKEYLDLAHIANEWFFGNNISKTWVYNPETTGCYDGINPEGVNLNQGAESTICYLLAQIAMSRFK